MEEYILYPEFVKRTSSIDHLLANNEVEATNEELCMKESPYYYDLKIPSVRREDLLEIHGILNSSYCSVQDGLVRIYLRKQFFTKQTVFVHFLKRSKEMTREERREVKR